jgi:subtilisin family serine protease
VTSLDDVARQLIVAVDDGASTRRIRELLAPFNPSLVREWQAESAPAPARFRVFRCRTMPPASVLRALNAPPDVIVERNLTLGVAAAAVNDPRYGEQWALARVAVEGAWTCLAEAPAVAPVTVAVVDSGIARAHPDLAARIDPASRRFVAGVPDTLIEDEDGHGTLLCGTIGAITDNALGIASAGGPVPVTLMALKFYDPWTPLDAATAAQAIYYAVDHGAHVINASWHVGMESATLRAAVEYAAAHDVVFVAAAGNEGLNNDDLPTWPASYASLPNVISVMASNRHDDRPAFSNYGDTTVHIAAPGVGVLSTHYYLETPPAYRNYAGTSVAAAHVAAAAAIVRAIAPTMTAQAIRDHLVLTADKRRFLRCVAGGRLNLRRAVCALA